MRDVRAELQSALALAYADLRDSARTIDAMQHAAAGDGDALPEYASRLAGELPSDPRIDAVWRRYNVDPARFARKAGEVGR